jgi:nuclear RNA export factor
MSTPRGGRGRGRGRGRGGQNFFQQQQADGDMQMNDTREYVPRGRGRGGQPFQSKPQYHNDGDQSMRDQNQNHFNSRGRGRGRGRGQHFQQDHNQAQPYIPDAERAQAQSETIALLEGFLGRRYDPNTKLLDLSSIASDGEVLKSGMFDSEKTQKKFFPALMIVCDEMLPSRAQKIEAIDSVSLANNNVPNLNVIYDLVKSLNHIKNLDLSGNAFASLGPLKPWKNRFKSLEHLIINPFPEPNWEDELTDWFPRLRILNGKQVRPDTNAQQQQTAVPAAAPTQCGTNLPAPAITADEQQKKEEMILFVQQATNLNREYAIQCLEAGQWDLQQASDLFAQSRQTLPPNAFVV